MKVDYNDAPPIFRELLDALIADSERCGFPVVLAELNPLPLGWVARMLFVCPCGNSLYLAHAIDAEYLAIYGREHIGSVVRHVRARGWSREHIERDVKNGTLDPGALQRYDDACDRRGVDT